MNISVMHSFINHLHILFFDIFYNNGIHLGGANLIKIHINWFEVWGLHDGPKILNFEQRALNIKLLLL